MSYSPTSTSTSSLSQVEIESRTRQALLQFDHNMAGIFDRASFYANDLYASVESNPTLTRAQTCFKYTLFGTNIVFLIFGIILMSVGSYAMNNRVAVLSGTTLPTGLIVLGVFIMVLSFTGGIAAYKESTMFLAVYFFFLLIFTIILFFVGIAVLVLKDSAEEYMVEGWNAADEDVRASLQVIFTCCGLTQTYNASGIAQPDPTAILPCPVSDECARTGCTTIAPPCKNSIVSSFRSGVTTAGACGISFSILMMAGLVIVIILMQGIKKKKAQAEIVQLRETMPDTLMDEPIL